MRVGNGADPVPVGAVADEVRREDGFGAGPDHRLDAVDVDLEGVGLDVDEDGDDARSHQRGDVARERERRRDDLVAGLAPQQLDGEAECGRSRVDHDAVALREQLGAAPLELGDVGSQVEQTACNTPRTASISRWSWTGPASVIL